MLVQRGEGVEVKAQDLVPGIGVFEPGEDEFQPLQSEALTVPILSLFSITGPYGT